MTDDISFQNKKILKIVITFFLLLIFSSSLIYFGSKNDSVSIAKKLKSGVLTADKINVSFENVGGKLQERYVEESDFVKKGDVLMQLDSTDLNIEIKKIKAKINAQEALIRKEETAIRTDKLDTDRLEITHWRQIEEIQANLNTAKSASQLAKNEMTKMQLTVVRFERQLAASLIGSTPEQQQKLTQKNSAEGMTLNSIVSAREQINNRFNQLQQYKAELSLLEEELNQLNVNVQRLTLIAPESGKVLSLVYEPGEIIPSGAPAVIIETERTYVDIYVNENSVNKFQPGTTVTAYAPAIMQSFQGKIRFSDATSSFSDLRMSREKGQADLTSYRVRIYFNKQPQLLTGMTIEVKNE
ncbi:HlyD family secretion protein [Providencia stuartii]|uniref:HlyD family secretion protein n=1 Tax=Providencia stuartii TaxID=588 RepID=UPI0015D622D4|nr:biotin/lipoyl-binding protein [Providencia stuartii]